MTKQILTQERLKEVLHYDPDTGIFTWSKTLGSRAAEGNIAGCIDKSTGYIVIRIDKCIYYSSRLAFLYMTGTFPVKCMDHINHNRTDDRWTNIRSVTQQENCLNASKRSDNTSGHVGIVWFKTRSKWTARINVNKKTIHLGYFTAIEDAIKARKDAEMKYGYHKNHGAVT